jgi:hypothetical protein
MDQSEFLEKHVFTDLTNLNDGFDVSTNQYFSQSDFEIVLERVEHFGIGVYKISPWYEGKLYDTANHEASKKKATDAKWYKKAFKTFTFREEGLAYSASYKVPIKLLARYSKDEEEEA